MTLCFISFQIDRKSAGFLKVADDPEEEDQFGYTQSK